MPVTQCQCYSPVLSFTSPTKSTKGRASLLRINHHLARVPLNPISNIWLLEAAGLGLVLVDTGHWSSRGQLLAGLWMAGIRRKGDLGGVILTHRHSDHAGNAAWLRERFHCPVFIHEHDHACLTGQAKPPIMARPDVKWPRRLLCHIEDARPSRCQIDETFAAGQWRAGFTVIHTPGHTDGSAMLYHEPTRTLFSGDTILSGIPALPYVEHFRLAEPAFSNDVETNWQAARDFIREMPVIDGFCPGHGPFVSKGMSRKLEALLHRR